MTETDDGPDPHDREARKHVWLRGLAMLIFAILFSVAQTILWVMTLLQFGWMLFAKEKNVAIADFGETMANWFAKTARFQTGATDERPFPWQN